MSGALRLTADTGAITARDLRTSSLSAQTHDGAIRISGRADVADLNADTGAVQATGLQSGRLTARTNDGAIRVTGRADTASLRTDTGGITATGLRSDRLSAHTSDGGVRLGLVAPPSSVQASTDTGSVNVLLPRDQTYNISMATDTGAKEIAPEVHNDSRSPRQVKLSTSDGSINVAGA
jgi:DUF4097 and DUF4098 domain-containing protein YvlB